MTDRLVLIFAYHYPPENAIGGVRPFRFAKYLSQLSYTCRVFTAADQSGRSDPNVQYVPDPFVERPLKSLSWQLERGVRKFLLPGDVGVHWSYYAARAARAWIRTHPSAQVTVLSTFPPLGTHLAGWQLARRNGLAWIADCRDPLTNDFADQQRTPSQRRFYRWMERVVAQRADAVIANTDAAHVRWVEKFPSLRDKFHLIWNGFDPEERIQPLPVASPDCMTLSHLGELYHGRNAAPILESIARLFVANRLPKGSVRVRLIGSAQAECLPPPEFIQSAQSEGWLDLVTERIPQQDARQVAQASDGFLLLQPRSADQVPAKLFEYLQIGRRILAFVQPNSPTERILERSGASYRCVYPDSTPETVDNTVGDFFDLPSSPVAPSPWFEEHFNVEHQTRILDSIIRSLHSAQSSRALTPIPGKSFQTARIVDSTRHR